MAQSRTAASTLMPQRERQDDRQKSTSSSTAGSSNTTSGPTATAASSDFSSSNASASKSSLLPSLTSESNFTLPVLDSSSFTTGKGGGALRSIDQQFNVNPSNGTLSLAVPIPVTSSRRDFQPSIALSYDSGSGNGPFGIGWQIGLPSISRKTSSHIPSYDDDTDVFVFSGEDLVALEAPDEVRDGYLVRRYAMRVRMEEEVRVERWTSTSIAGETFWRTISSDNVTNFYGKEALSREFQKTTSGARTFAWLLCESHDAFGNAITYSYKAENDEGIDGLPHGARYLETSKDVGVRSRARYLKRIKYGNREPSRDLETWNVKPNLSEMRWRFSVLLDYGEHDKALPTTTEVHKWNIRQDRFSSARTGFEMRIYRLCERVLMFHHFSEELGLTDYLVKSTDLTFDARPTGSLLKTIVQTGYAFDKGTKSYMSESLAPLEMSYSSLPPADSLRIGTTRPACLQTLDVSRPEAVTRWVDLDSEGSPGLLVQMDGAWYFQRNENALTSGSEDGSLTSDSGAESSSDSDSDEHLNNDFGPIRQLRSVPNVGDHTKTSFEDLDGSGVQNLVLVDSYGRTSGYYERLGAADDWSQLQYIDSIPNVDLATENIQRVDLTGNGLGDVLMPGEDPGDLSWHPNFGKRGFGMRRDCRLTHDREVLRIRLVGDENTAVFVADMTGDGLQDIVHVSAGRVIYFPNLGYGNFASEVNMSNAPPLCETDDFVPSRIQLLDVDGSGTIDIIYLHPLGGATVFFNECGNGFSDGMYIPQFPQINRLSSVFALDILGKGTSCLCWAGPESSSTDSMMIYYLDLAPHGKPHLLMSYSDGNGQETKIKYRPSTSFYLQDEREGRKWVTSLPFPVHAVARVTKRDEIAGHFSTTTYRYHDGFYDPWEREFRGFGNVEMWDTEQISMVKDKSYKSPTRHTKLWYHTGANESSLLPKAAFGEIRLRDVIPQLDRQTHRREAFRSLKGLQIRSEIYGGYDTESASAPYTVEESTYSIDMLQKPKTQKGHAICRVLPQEKATITYERQIEQPNVYHELVLTRNTYGSVTKMLEIHYGCTKSDVLIQSEDGAKTRDRQRDATREQIQATQQQMARTLQETNHAILSEVIYTNAIETPDNFFKPIMAGSKQTHFAKFKTDGLIGLLHAKEDPSIVFSNAEITRGKESITYFRTADLKGRLPAGKIEGIPLADQSYELSITDEQSKQIKLHSNDTLDVVMQVGGYVRFGDKDWWRPSSTVRFSEIPDNELAQARRSFFTSAVQKDAFGNMSIVQMDGDFILPIRSFDPLGNTTTAMNCCRALQPAKMIDCNGNRYRVVFDALGEQVATARMGKKSESVGDEPGFEEDDERIEDICLTSEDEARSFLQHPTKEAAEKALAGWGTRTLTSRRRLTHLGVKLPRFRVNLTRSEHTNSRSGNNHNVYLQISFLDGRQNPIQTSSIASWTKNQWVVSGCGVKNKAGQMIQGYQSFFTEDPKPIPRQEITAPYAFAFFDANGRQVAKLNEDKSWEKIHYTPRSMTVWDEGATLEITDPSADDHVGVYFSSLGKVQPIQTWLTTRKTSSDVHARAAAEKTVTACRNTYNTMYSDARGNTIMYVEVMGEDGARATVVEHDVFGQIVREIDSLGRVVQQKTYGQLGHAVVMSSMDGGKRTLLTDCMGGELYHLGVDDTARYYVRDVLRRLIEIRVRERGVEGAKAKLWCRTTYGEGIEAAASRNFRGRVARVEDQAGVRTIEAYDFKGNLLAENRQSAVDYKNTIDWSDTKAIALEQPVRTTTEYDAAERPILSTDMLGRKTRRTFNLLGGLVSLESRSSGDQEWTAHISNATYTADIMPEIIQYEDSMMTRYVYDDETGRLVRKTTKRSDGVIIEDIEHTYDCLGRISRTTDAAQPIVFFRNRKIEPAQEFWYDTGARLLRATGREMIQENGSGVRSHPNGSNGVQKNGQELVQYCETYSYDDADNMLSMVHDVSDAATPGWSRQYNYEEESSIEKGKKCNRLSFTVTQGTTGQVRYNTSGEVVKMPGFSDILWDSFGKVRCVTRQKLMPGSDMRPEQTWYVYDADGVRIRKVTERFSASNSDGSIKLKDTIYIGSAERYVLYEGDGVTVDDTTATSHIGTDPGSSPIVTIEDLDGDDDEPLMRYLLSPNLEVDDEGRTVSYEEYSPFGTSTYLMCARGITAPSEYRFAARRRDSETGFYLCGKRYYCPWLARWMSTDPVGTDDGINVYCYCRNDPVNYDDPEGTMRGNCERRTVKFLRLGFGDKLNVGTLLSGIPGSAGSYFLSQLLPDKTFQKELVKYLGGIIFTGILAYLLWKYLQKLDARNAARATLAGEARPVLALARNAINNRVATGGIARNAVLRLPIAGGNPVAAENDVVIVDAGQDGQLPANQVPAEQRGQGQVDAGELQAVDQVAIQIGNMADDVEADQNEDLNQSLDEDQAPVDIGGNANEIPGFGVPGAGFRQRHVGMANNPQREAQQAEIGREVGNENGVNPRPPL